MQQKHLTVTKQTKQKKTLGGGEIGMILINIISITTTIISSEY